LRTPPAVLAAILLTAGPLIHAARAQEIPGADTEAAGHMKADHLAYVLANADTLINQWRSAWSSEAPDRIAALYAQDALLIPSGGVPILGREAIGRYFEEVLQPSGDIGISLGDVGVGEEIAYLFGDYRFVDTPRHDPDAIWSGLADPGSASTSRAEEPAPFPWSCNGGEPGTGGSRPPRAKDGTGRPLSHGFSSARIQHHERRARDVERILAAR
jgi:ketosteroid isomerase-like protein